MAERDEKTVMKARIALFSLILGMGIVYGFFAYKAASALSELEHTIKPTKMFD